MEFKLKSDDYAVKLIGNPLFIEIGFKLVNMWRTFKNLTI